MGCSPESTVRLSMADAYNAKRGDDEEEPIFSWNNAVEAGVPAVLGGFLLHGLYIDSIAATAFGALFTFVLFSLGIMSGNVYRRSKSRRRATAKGKTTSA